MRVKKKGLSLLLAVSMVVGSLSGFVAPTKTAEAASKNTVKLGQSKTESGYYTYPNTKITLATDDKILNYLSVSVDSGYIVPTVISLNGTTGKGIVPGTTSLVDISASGQYETITFSVTNGAAATECESFLAGLKFYKNGSEEQNVSVYGSYLKETTVPSNPWGGKTNVYFFNGHYYAYVTPENCTWKNSYTAAKQISFNGLTGYLMTLTSAQEDRFVHATFNHQEGWMGATRATTASGKYDEASPSWNALADFDTTTLENNKWRWACGPEAGTVFGYQTSAYGVNDGNPDGGFQAYPGHFSNWRNDSNVEPNGGSPAGNYYEGYAYYAVTSSGSWNDHPDNSYRNAYVEFGGYSDDVTNIENAGGVIISTTTKSGSSDSSGSEDNKELEREKTPKSESNFVSNRLENLVAGADYVIEIDGKSYKFTADASGSVLLSGTDANGQEYDMKQKTIYVVKTGDNVNTIDSYSQKVLVYENAAQMEREKTPEAVPDYDTGKLTNLVPNAGYTITSDGQTYTFVADGSGTIPITGEDKNGRLYDFNEKTVAVVKTGDNVETLDSYAQAVLISKQAEESGELPPANEFIEDYVTRQDGGGIITEVTDTTRDIIISGKDSYENLSDADKSTVNQIIADAGGNKDYEQLLAEAEDYKIPGFKVTKLMQKKTKAKLKKIKTKGAIIIVTTTNKKIGTVNKAGKITAKKKGVATLTYIAIKGKYTARYIIKLKVRKKFKNAKELKHTNTKDIKTPAVLISKQRRLKRTSRIKVFDALPDSKILYHVYKKKILTINKKGKYKGKKKGDTVVRIKVWQNDKVYWLYVYVRIY